MTRDELLAFLRAHRIAVEATVAADGAPQAAVIGYGVSDQLELVFDTVDDTRKCKNLRRDPRIALVIGWDDAQTVQLQGVCDEPTGDELARIRQVYFAAYPDGVDRLAWPGITHVRVRITWARYSDFRGAAPRIVEVTFP
jgi:PPOX class probable F420-dependent enzyme